MCNQTLPHRSITPLHQRNPNDLRVGEGRGGGGTGEGRAASKETRLSSTVTFTHVYFTNWRRPRTEPKPSGPMR